MGQIKNQIAVAAKAYAFSGISLPSGAYTVLSLNTNIYDTSSIHSTTVNPTRFTAPVAGKYIVCSGLRFSGNSSGSYRALQIAKNQVTFASSWLGPNAAPLTNTVTDIVDLSVGDYVEMYAYQDSGVSLSTLSGQDAVWLSMALLR